MVNSIRGYTRVVIELDGPCSIGVGDESFASDAPFVVSANGLPMLPGTSLAGLLRAAAAKIDVNVDAWFGFQTKDGGRASRVRVSNAHVHDSDNVAVDGRLASEGFTEFLGALAVGEVREHVAIGHTGAAKDAQKFDRQVVLAGTRFSFDLEIVGDAGEEGLVRVLRDQLLAALKSSATRLGGRKYAGLGAFHVVSAHGDVLDLRDAADFGRYRDIPVRLDARCGLSAVNLSELPVLGIDASVMEGASLASIEVRLSPETFFFIGGGEVPVTKDGEKAGAQITSVRTRRVEWKGGKGVLSAASYYLPGTALKGALSHRVAFHYNRLRGIWADEGVDLDSHVGEKNGAVREIFGYALNSSGEGEGTGQAGRLIVEDVSLKQFDGRERKLTHVSIDPFTGGAKSGHLFGEEVLGGFEQVFGFTLLLREPDTLSRDALDALRLALDDLCEGRLGLGGGYSRGNGHFDGSFVWPASLSIASKIVEEEVVA